MLRNSFQSIPCVRCIEVSLSPIFATVALCVVAVETQLQNRAARIVTNSNYDAPAANLIKELKWPTVHDIRLF